MKIAQIMKGERESGDQIFILNKKESAELINVFQTFCIEHKRRTNAKKMLKQFENEVMMY